jgi:hypothetical protein
MGYEVTGMDPSKDGVRIVDGDHPNLRIAVGSAYDDLAANSPG